MFNKPNNSQEPATPPALRTETTGPAKDEAARPNAAATRPQKMASLIASDMTLEGNITGGGEIHIDGTIKGDVRIERVTIGDGGHVEGGVYSEAVEVRGRITGSITAKQVRLYGACHVDGDITHEQLAIETGAFFQGRSLRLQRPATPAPTPLRPSEAAAAAREASGVPKPSAP